jgi:mono/diheme cytochrome c family protein
MVAMTGVLAVFVAGCGDGADDTPASAGSGGRSRTMVADRFVRERAMFNRHCGSCHTLEDAGATGTRAKDEADLDALRPNISSVEYYALRGYGRMPSLRDRMSRQEIRDLAFYVAAVDSCGTESPTGCNLEPK